MNRISEFVSDVVTYVVVACVGVAQLTAAGYTALKGVLSVFKTLYEMCGWMACLLIVSFFVSPSWTGGRLIEVFLFLTGLVVTAEKPPEPEMIVGYSGTNLLWVVVGSILANLALMVFLLRKKPRVVPVLANYPVYSNFCLESSVPGSRLFNCKLPKFCAIVEVKIEGKWYRSGLATRTEHGILTPGHVVVQAEEIRLTNGVETRVVRNDDILATSVDMVIIPETYVLRDMSKAKLSKVAMDVGQAEMVTATDGAQASIGPLTVDPVLFGHVRYEGSTLPGFSGSPYFVGSVVLGFHIGNRNHNFGLEAAYVNALLKEESSEDWLLAKIKSGRQHKFRRSPFDPDEVMVKMGGSYFTVDRYAYELAMEERDRDYEEEAENYAEQVVFGATDDELRSGRRRKTNRFVHRPIQLESAVALTEFKDDSGNVQMPAVAVLPSAGEEKIISTRPAPDQNMPTTNQTASSAPSSDQPTARLESTRAQKNQASPSTSGSTPPLTKTMLKRQKERDNIIRGLMKDGWLPPKSERN